MKTVKIRSNINPSVVINTGICNTFYTRLMGFMFKTSLDPNFGLLFDEGSETRINSAIHMFFMSFDLAIIWLNSDFHIVDKVFAKKWHPFYISGKPARYVWEIHETRINDFSIGDRLELVNED